MNIITFDIEDWYCHDNYSQNTNWNSFEVRIYDPLYKILDTLDEVNVKGTFFCLGWLAENLPDIIKEIDKRGHHIGCHSYQHQLASRLDKKSFIQDTTKAKMSIEDLIGKSVDAYRAPSYSITDNNLYAFEALVEMGFKYDCSVFPTSRECGGLLNYGNGEPKIINTKSGIIKEFPINIYNFMGHNLVFSGGGYFRILPYALIRRLTQNSNYVMSYFHPSDFDPDQPKMRHLPIMRQIKNEIGLSRAFKMFNKYMNEFEFINLVEADKLVDWNNTDIISL